MRYYLFYLSHCRIQSEWKILERDGTLNEKIDRVSHHL